MPSEAQILAVDGCPDRPRKTCHACGHPQPIGEFGPSRKGRDGLRTTCLRCDRLASYTYYHEGGGREAKADYLARPDVRERRRRLEAARKGEPRRVSNLAYAATPRGRLVLGRCRDRFELRRAVDPGKRATIEARIALYDREIARLDRGHELPAEPAPPAGDCDYRGVHRTRHGTFSVVVSVPGKGQVRGGSHPTIEAARAEANRLAFEHGGVRDYAIPKWRRQA